VSHALAEHQARILSPVRDRLTLDVTALDSAMAA
jgi:hypothetical protein